MRKASRRIVRTIMFDRILAFTAAICFAVALVTVFLSVKEGDRYLKVPARTVYAVTAGSSAAFEGAEKLSSECALLGGGGYLLERENTYHCIAAVYAERADAVSVREGMPEKYGSLIIEITVPELRLDPSADLYAEIAVFCAYTLPDALQSVGTQLDLGELSGTAALDKCEKYAENISELMSKVSGEGSADETHNRMSELLSETARRLQDIRSTDKKLVSAFRYAHAACIVGAASAAQALSKG